MTELDLNGMANNTECDIPNACKLHGMQNPVIKIERR